MSKHKDYDLNDVRIAFKVSSNLKGRLLSKLEWGQLRPLFTSITQDLVTLLEENDPNAVTAAIISKQITLEDIINSSTLKNKRTDAT